MESKKAYQEKLEAQLKEWSSKMEELKAKAQKATADAKVELEKQIETLRGKQEALQQKLKQIKEAGAEAWEKLKAEADKAVGEAKSLWEKVKARF
jgi:TolA-binding protein